MSDRTHQEANAHAQKVTQLWPRAHHAHAHRHTHKSPSARPDDQSGLLLVNDDRHFFFLYAPPTPGVNAVHKAIHFVIDLSGSMNERIGDKTRLEVGWRGTGWARKRMAM